MNFVSLQAGLFVLLVLVAHRYIASARTRTGLLTIVSVGFIFFQTPYMILNSFHAVVSGAVMIIGWLTGKSVAGKEGKKRSNAFGVGVALTVAPLVLFKVVTGVIPMQELDTLLVQKLGWDRFQFIPIGLSYFTFRAVSYLVEIKRDKLKPVGFWRYAFYLSFWPTFLSGPIERPQPFLTQAVAGKRSSDEDIMIGLSRIVTGLVKKVVIGAFFFALTSPILDLQVVSVPLTIGQWHWWQLWLGLFAYYLYLYCDFSGYTDIAIGVSRLFGFKIMENFRWPILATNPSTFWQRWHISLTSWVGDYIYRPLGGGKRGLIIAARNTTIALLIVALWHGFNGHFFCYGIYQASLLIAFRQWRKVVKPKLPAQWFDNKPFYLFSWFLFQTCFAFGFGFFLFKVKDALLIYKAMFGF